MKNNDLKNENEIRTNQFNPKLRLFLLILCNWFFGAFLFLFIPCIILIPYLSEHFYIPIIVFSCFLIFIVFYRYYLMRVGIRYLIKDLRENYLKENSYHLQKINNMNITDFSQFFNVVPLYPVVEIKKQKFKKQKKEFQELSWIEACINRLVVNGTINNLDFSWGIVTKMKKSNLKIFLIAILYFGPIFGFFWGLFPQKMVNENYLIKPTIAQSICNPKVTTYSKLKC